MILKSSYGKSQICKVQSNKFYLIGDDDKENHNNNISKHIFRPSFCTMFNVFCYFGDFILTYVCGL